MNLGEWDLGQWSCYRWTTSRSHFFCTYDASLQDLLFVYVASVDSAGNRPVLPGQSIMKRRKFGVSLRSKGMDKAPMTSVQTRGLKRDASKLQPGPSRYTTYFMTMSISLKIEFGGGLELLFSNKRSHQITIPANPGDKPANITFLIFWLKDNLLKEREELFIESGTV